MSTANPPITLKDLKAADPRWCTGCGDYTILVGLRRFMVQRQIDPTQTVNISGIGCSGRLPHYMNTYGMHTIHGRAIPVALGLALTRPDLQLFISSGDGDALSIGGNHLIHGIHKNFNCVFVLFDNQIYGLTKNQTSPTSRQGLVTMTQPQGSPLIPINPVQFALGLGATFVASTAEWMGQHFLDTIDLAFQHRGFSFVHVAQRCPKFNPSAWDHENASWLSFLTDETGVPADHKAAPDAKVVPHDPSDMGRAFQYANGIHTAFGLFYRTERPMYDELTRAATEKAPKKDRKLLLDGFKI